MGASWGISDNKNNINFTFVLFDKRGNSCYINGGEGCMHHRLVVY